MPSGQREEMRKSASTARDPVATAPTAEKVPIGTRFASSSS
jgi:hypothetical protein